MKPPTDQSQEPEINPKCGATDTPGTVGVPSMEPQVTSDEIVAVAAFERAQFGRLVSSSGQMTRRSAGSNR
jgi:hypothetical protein